MNLQHQIDQWHEQQPDAPRYHLGCSIAGYPCDRYIWLSFRWAMPRSFPGRILRIFRRGVVEEEWVDCDLACIGATVKSRQARVDLGCHVGGSIDGIVSHLPDTDGSEHLLEIKTHNRKSFNGLVKHGVRKSHPQHWVQCQLYMLALALRKALYYAVCKDDDRIHTEAVALDLGAAMDAKIRAQSIALEEHRPRRLSQDEDHWQCKLCSYHGYCHPQGDTVVELQTHCRTCGYVLPLEDSTWRCNKHGERIPHDWQIKGCAQHVTASTLWTAEAQGNLPF